jgi:RNA polymerase sigma-70 factor (ECF subfamily)
VTTTDSDLVTRLQAGDANALAALYVKYSSTAYTVALRILKSPAAAEDVLQELFLYFWRTPNNIKLKNDSLYGFMAVAARNRAITILRQRQPVSLDGVVLVSSLRADEESQRRLTCERLIKEAPVELQVLLKMAFYLDMSYSEIAASTGIPLGTIKTRIRRGLSAIRKTVSSEVKPSLPPAVLPPLLMN